MGELSLERMFYKRQLAMLPQVLSGEFEKQQGHLQMQHLDIGPDVKQSSLYNLHSL